jgi:uncharacterized protein (DUF362 family)
MNRREFLHRSFIIGAGFSFLPSLPWEIHNLNSTQGASNVVEITNSMVRGKNSFSQSVIEKMLDEGIAALYRTNEPEKIWKQLFSRNEVVGIKVNCLSGSHCSSHPVLVEAIIEKLKQTGIEPGNIIIWDRLNQDLESAGYRINWKDKNKIRCYGNDIAGYDDRLYINGSVGSLISRTLIQTCSAIINVPVLKDHGIVGITLSMKNFFGAIHNPNKYHSKNGNPYIADLYQINLIRQKTRLTICDALDAQYEGGPPFKPQWTWPFNGLLIGVDGVALDRVGWQIIENKRKEKDFPDLATVGRKPEYILTAGQKGIGQSDLSKINWQKIK